MADRYPTTDAIHCDGNSLVCLAADGAQGHAAGTKAGHYVAGRLHLCPTTATGRSYFRRAALGPGLHAKDTEQRLLQREG